MKKTILLISLLASFTTFGQAYAPSGSSGGTFSSAVTAPSFTSTAADEANGFMCTNEGCMICLSGVNCVQGTTGSLIGGESSSHGVAFQSNASNNQLAFNFITLASRTSGGKLFEFADNNVARMSMDHNGTVAFTPVGSGTAISIANTAKIALGNGSFQEQSTSLTQKWVSAVVNSGTNSAFTLDTTTTPSGTTTLLDVKNNGTTKMSLDNAGALTVLSDVITGASAVIKSVSGALDIRTAPASTLTLQRNTNTGDSVDIEWGTKVGHGYANALTISGSAAASPVTLTATGSDTNISVNNVPKGSGSLRNNGDPMPGVHAAQTTAQISIEFGTATLVAGSKAVTFATAFSIAPKCTCSDTSGSVLACVHGGASTTAVTFSGISTDSVDWICIGAR